jgi:uncharacterized caspase-like protein
MKSSDGMRGELLAKISRIAYRIVHFLFRMGTSQAVLCVCISAAVLKMTESSSDGENSYKVSNVALIIANFDYKNAFELSNVDGQAEELGRKLERLGFSVILKKNLTLPEMKEVTDSFIQIADRSLVAMFYFAGHAVQYKSNNYLLPIGVSNQITDPNTRALQAEFLLSKYEKCHARIRLFILDASRNPPKESNFRPGLAPMRVHSEGTLIAFAAAPGEVEEGNFFPRVLSRHLEDSSSVVRVFTETQEEVAENTDYGQQPWILFSAGLSGTSITGQGEFSPKQ